MNILALDMATTTGWAIGSDRTRPISGKATFRGEIGEFAFILDNWVAHMVHDYKITSVVVEAPVVAQKTNMATTMKLIGAQVIAHKVTYGFGIPCTPINVSTWRKAFIGRSKAPAEITPSNRRKWLKAAVIKECERRGYVVTSNDEADALGLLTYAISQRGTPCGQRKC